MKTKLTPRQTALLILVAHEAYEKDRDRSISRFRLGRNTLRRLAGRTRAREAFIECVKDELLDFGWVMFDVSDQFGLLRIDRVDTWQRIAGKRIAEQVAEAHADPQRYFDALEKQFMPEPDEESGDE